MKLKIQSKLAVLMLLGTVILSACAKDESKPLGAKTIAPAGPEKPGPGSGGSDTGGAGPGSGGTGENAGSSSSDSNEASLPLAENNKKLSSLRKGLGFKVKNLEIITSLLEEKMDRYIQNGALVQGSNKLDTKLNVCFMISNKGPFNAQMNESLSLTRIDLVEGRVTAVEEKVLMSVGCWKFSF
jgi:hypothetical protein